MESRPVIETYLLSDAGEWVPVPVGSITWPAEPYAAPVPALASQDDTAAEAAERAKRKAADDAAQARKRAAAAIKVEGES